MITKIVSMAMLAMAISIPASSQVMAEYTPMPLTVLKSLHFKDLGPWQARVCNVGAETIILAPEHIYMAAPSVRWVDASLAINMLTIKQGQSWQSFGANAVEIGADFAGMFGGTGTFFKLSVSGLAKLAALSYAAHYAHDKLQAAVPSTAPFTASLLTKPVTLSPKGSALTPDGNSSDCRTITMYAGKMKNPQPFSAVIDFTLKTTPPATATAPLAQK